MNLKIIIDENGKKENDIGIFGMDYFKFRISIIFEQIFKEEIEKITKWEELKSNLDSNNELDIQKILKEINLDNISTKFLSQDSNNLIKSLIEEKMQKIKISIKKFPLNIAFKVCKKCKKINLDILMLDYYIKENENKELELTLNQIKIKKILDDFIIYKIKCISSIDYYFQNINNKNSNNKQNNKKITKNVEYNNNINNNNINLNNDDDNISEKSTRNTSFDSNINLNTIVNNVKGIRNNLNDCFIISIIQCLIHCKPFIEQLFKEKNIKNLNGITKEFIEICEKQTSNYIIDSLHNFKNEIWK